MQYRFMQAHASKFHIGLLMGIERGTLHSSKHGGLAWSCLEWLQPWSPPLSILSLTLFMPLCMHISWFWLYCNSGSVWLIVQSVYCILWVIRSILSKGTKRQPQLEPVVTKITWSHQSDKLRWPTVHRVGACHCQCHAFSPWCIDEVAC